MPFLLLAGWFVTVIASVTVSVANVPSADHQAGGAVPSHLSLVRLKLSTNISCSVHIVSLVETPDWADQETGLGGVSRGNLSGEVVVHSGHGIHISTEYCINMLILQCDINQI